MGPVNGVADGIAYHARARHRGKLPEREPTDSDDELEEEREAINELREELPVYEADMEAAATLALAAQAKVTRRTAILRVQVH